MQTRKKQKTLDMFLGQPAPLVTNGEASQWEERGTLLLYNRLAASPAETLHVAAFDLVALHDALQLLRHW